MKGNEAFNSIDLRRLCALSLATRLVERLRRRQEGVRCDVTSGAFSPIAFPHMNYKPLFYRKNR
jgi:hypothetical protein